MKGSDLPDGIIGHLRAAITVGRAMLNKDLVEIEREVKDSQQQSQKREAKAIADVRNVLGQLGGLIEENDRHVLAGAELPRAKEHQVTEVFRLKLPVDLLEHDDWWL